MGLVLQLASVLEVVEKKNLFECCGSETIFSDPDPIFRRVLDPDPT
jgi:hypothetical protein